MKLICISSGIVLIHRYFGLNSPMFSIAMCSRVSLCFSRMYCLASLTYKNIKLMNILLLTYYYFLQNFIFTAVNSLVKFLYLLFFKKEVQQYIQTISFPRILKLSKQLIYFIFVTYSVKALFWIIYCYMHVETVLCG